MTTLLALQLLLLTTTPPVTVEPIVVGPQSAGETLCFCVCAAPTHELQDVTTSGSCSALVGQTCYGKSGIGTFTFCIPG